MRDFLDVMVSGMDTFSLILPNGSAVPFGREKLAELRSQIDKALNTSQDELDDYNRVRMEYKDKHPFIGASVPADEAAAIKASAEELGDAE